MRVASAVCHIASGNFKYPLPAFRNKFDATVQPQMALRAATSSGGRRMFHLLVEFRLFRAALSEALPNAAALQNDTVIRLLG
jgi:hypothetical protein